MTTLRGNIVVEGKTFGDNENASSLPAKYRKRYGPTRQCEVQITGA
jgi:hypothetical protein